MKQTLGYMEKCGTEEGHLVVFDRRSEECRGDDGEADENGPRQDRRGVAVWTL